MPNSISPARILYAARQLILSYNEEEISLSILVRRLEEIPDVAEVDSITQMTGANIKEILLTLTDSSELIILS